MIINIEDRSTVDRNPYDGTMDDRGVTAFLISSHYRIYRHILSFGTSLCRLSLFGDAWEGVWHISCLWMR